MIIHATDYPQLLESINDFYETLQTKIADIDGKYYVNDVFGISTTPYGENINYLGMLLFMLIEAKYENANDVLLDESLSDLSYIPDCIRKFFKCRGIIIDNVIQEFI